MQLNIVQLAKKEISIFFASPSAFLFLGTYLAVTLFIFFWVETFFARNIADVRPLFEWMPILLAFLCAALTMKLWSEERRMGTLEFLLTKPVGVLQLVLSKFIACLALVGIALSLTIFVPLSVSILGNVDWGPIFGAYIATFGLAAAYLAIGLTISANSDNQIVSLISTTCACLLLYAIGSDPITAFFSSEIGDFLKLLGSGSRFAAISRGVLDLRDIYYYFSIVGVFLSLNVYFLEKVRWANNWQNKLGSPANAKVVWRLFTGLLVVNFIVSNIWLQQLHGVRLDLTQGKIYSISTATKDCLARLQEPLVLRGYFSSKLHPMLAPLAPQLKDLLHEYELAAKDKVHVEIIDPLAAPELELEANEKYGLKPVPFQVADKYQASLVNAYFNVVVQYGDEFAVLNFRDLIEVHAKSETDFDVTLRNPEYELTRVIKNVAGSYQAGSDLFASIEFNNPLQFTSYISAAEKLPAALVDFKRELTDYLAEQTKVARGKLTVVSYEPESNNGVIAQKIADKYGFQAMRTDWLDPNSFYFYLTLQQGEQIVQIPIPSQLNFAEFKRSFAVGVKRFILGQMKTLAFYDGQNLADNYLGLAAGAQQSFTNLRQKLGQDYILKDTDLKEGVIADDVDVLVVVKPKQLDQKQLFAIDQFLMKGGSVVLATSPYSIKPTAEGFAAEKITSGLADWLRHHGLQIADSMVLDPQNSRIAIPIDRQIAGLTIQDYHLLEYPYFVDIRSSGLNQDHMLTSSLPQLTMSWASPIIIESTATTSSLAAAETVTADAAATERIITPLVHSSEQSWLADSLAVADFANGKFGGQPDEQRQAHMLGAMLEGKFTSFFTDKDSPLLVPQPAANDEQFEQVDANISENKDINQSENKDISQTDKSKQGKSADKPIKYHATLTKSPSSARIILFASNEFLTDEVIRLVSMTNNDMYLNSLQLLENSVDWALADHSLLSIRSRGHFVRTLQPMGATVRMYWEYGNYLLAIFGLVVIFMARIYYRRKNVRRQQLLLQG